MSPTTVIQVALVEDNPVEREALTTLLRSAPGIVCAAVCASALEARDLLPRCRPDIVLMDINMVKESGIDCVRSLRPMLRDAQFMMLTVVEDHDRIFESLRAGATGYLLKSTSPAKLLEAIRELHEGGAPMSGQIARQVIRAFRKEPSEDPTDLLTATEHRVLELLALGLIYKEVGERLSISLSTVRTHIWHIYRKLQVRNRTEAIRKGLQS
jgi:DNA-binding NarL/FixJ family response regulator